MAAIPGLIPARIRVRLRSIRGFWRAARAARAPQIPVARARHTPDALATIARGRVEQRARQLAAALSGGERAAFAHLRDLEVVDVVRHGDLAVTLTLANDPDDPIAFHPGQFLTVLMTLEDGASLRRAYSMCSDPADTSQLSITVKRVPDGLGSNRLNDRVEVGDRLRVLGPSGDFGLIPDPEDDAPIVLIGGGAGITPLLSVLRAVVARQPRSPLALIYGNRDAASILFRDALDALATTHPALTLVHVLERLDDDAPTGARAGRLDPATLAAVTPLDPRARFLICGPPAMAEVAEGFLLDAGVEPERVLLERFVTQAPPRSDDAMTNARAGTGAVHSVRFARSGVMLQVPDGQTLLDAGRAAGLELPFSCAMGGCGACKVRRLEGGEVEHESPHCLSSREEQEHGACLMCVARPRSSLILDI